MIEEEVGQPAAIVSEDLHLAGNMRLQIPGAPSIMPQYTAFRPAIAPGPERPVVVVWMGRRGEPLAPMPAQAVAFAPAATGAIDPAGTGPLSLPYKFRPAGHVYHFSHAR